METSSSPLSKQRKGAAAGPSFSATRSTNRGSSKMTSDSAQAQKPHESANDKASEDAPEACESSTEDHCSDSDNGDLMEIDNKSQSVEQGVGSATSQDSGPVDQDASRNTTEHVSDRDSDDNHSNSDSSDDDDNGSASSGNDRQTEMEPNPGSGLDTLAGIFGGQSSFNPQTFGFNFGHIASVGNTVQFQSLTSALKQTGDPTTQFIALQELVELLAMSTEESFISVNISELTQLLVNLLKGDGSELNGNPDSILLACRCLSNLLEALPLSGSIMCRHGAIEALCSKLFDIEYIDLAEQALLTLEHLSMSFPDKICDAGGMSACLTFLDFFPTSVQRCALTCASNCAKSITNAHFSQVKDALQVLERTMFSEEQSIASLSCTALLYLTNAFRSSPDKIEELVPERLLKSIIESANRDGTSFVAATCTVNLRILAIVLHSSSTRATQALDLNLLLALKSIFAHEFMLSDITSNVAPVNGHTPTNISEQAWCTLHLMVILLPQLPVDQKAFCQAEMIVARDFKHSDEGLCTHDSQLQRLVATVTRPAIMKQLQELFIPLATRIFTVTTDTVARYRLLQTILKIVFIVNADSLRVALENVYLAPFIANALSAVDSPILLGISMLIVRIVLEKLPGIYEAEFIREGVADSLENLASNARAALEKDTSPEEASLTDSNTDPMSGAESNEFSSSEHGPVPGSDSKSEEQHYDPNSLVSGFKMVCIHLSAASRSVLNSKLQQFASISSSSEQSALSRNRRSLLNWILGQARDLHDALQQPNSLANCRNGDDVLAQLKDISKRLDPTDDESHDNVALCVAELARLITSTSGVTCYELTHSGVIESLSRSLCILSDKAADEQTAKTILDGILPQLFSCHVQSTTSQSLSTTAFAILVQRLQEVLCLTERLQVFDVYRSATDEAKPPIHMLTKHVRFLVLPSNSCPVSKPEYAAEKDYSPRIDDATISRIRRSLHPMTIGVHAISTFGTIEAYLRPRVALCIGTKHNAHGMPGLSKENGMPVRLTDSGGNAHRMHSQESQLERHSANPSSDNGSDAQPNDDEQADSGSSTDHLRLLQTIARSSGIDLRSVGLFDSLDSQESDNESRNSDDSHSDNGSSDGMANIDMARAHVLESEQHTNELYPSIDTNESDASAASENKASWRLVMTLKFGNSERVVNNTDTIFGVLCEMCQNDPKLKDTASLWSTTFALEFHVELDDSAQPVNRQQNAQCPGNTDSKDHGVGMGNQTDVTPGSLSELRGEGAVIVKLLDVLYRMVWQARGRISSIRHRFGETTNSNQEMMGFLLSSSQYETLEAIRKLFVNLKLDSKLRQQLGIPLIVVCSALPGWCHGLTKHAPYLLSFDTRLTYLRVSSFGYTRSISYWQELARREARRNGRPYAETQIPLGRIQRQKVRISRPRMLESAFKVLDMYGSAKTVLEIEYFDEAGVGNGPTLEFYSLVSRCLQESALGIWRDECSAPDAMRSIQSSKSGHESDTSGSEPPQYVHAPLGLFPRAVSATKAAQGNKAQSQQGGPEFASLSDRSVKMFQFIGHFVAKSLIDNRILDLPLHEEFWAAVQRHSQAAPSGGGGVGDSVVSWTWCQLENLDAQFAGSLKYLQRFVDAKTEIYARNDLDTEQKQRKVLEFRDPKDQASVEELALDFTLPGDPTIELRPGGSEIPVTINNVHAYIDLVAQWTLHTGVCTQVAAFCEGFNRIFPVTSLSIFTPAELCRIFGPSGNSEDWSAATITSCIEPGDGYSLTSPPVQMMVRLLESLSVGEQREFLRFSTGSPRLPIGGFRALSPPLRLVLKANEPPLMPDDYLPSVMTCSNLIKMPAYSSFEILKKRWNQAISEDSYLIKTSVLASMEANPRGIPKAPFVDNVDEYMKSDEVEATLRKFTEAASKYRFMENSKLQQRASLEQKIPEIEKSLDLVKYLSGKRGSEEPVETLFEVNDTLYAHATIPPTDTVNLWLGANVMLEYTLDEARELLSSKLGIAKTNLDEAIEDLEFLRDQITTMEVNTARVYNWDVKRRRAEKNEAPL
ncbi:Ubiquitin fusion degradation protein 4 [Coemansia sp. RSA 1813]|nr:Ubiquitin fusion degradation protein 4 [Coemansia sp. RSA 986]KAJ2572772.1 Ubiquitin fusion degradation protein 4 [Coemansia sp. RSA 1813]